MQNVTVTKLNSSGGALQKTQLESDMNTIGGNINAQKDYPKNEDEENDTYNGEDEEDDTYNGEDEDEEDDTYNEDEEEDENEGEVKDPVSGGGNKKETDTESSVSTTELLSRDPLYLVLNNFLCNDNGENLVDVLSKINRNIVKLINAIEKQKK